MRRVLAFSIPALVVVFVALGLVTWRRGALPGFQPTVHDVAWSALSEADRGVRVSGTAHYPVRLKAGDPADGPVSYLFPLFDKGDTAGREIRVLVKTRIAPDPLLGYEERTVVGLVQPIGNSVPSDARHALELEGYTFAPAPLLITTFED